METVEVESKVAEEEPTEEGSTEVDSEASVVDEQKPPQKGFLVRLSLFFQMFIVSVLIAITWTSRNDANVNLIVASKILPFEKGVGFEMSALKGLLGVELELSSEELFIQLGEGDYMAARMLLDAGADVNAFNGLGETPLSFASRDLGSELVELLLSSGANPNIPDGAGFYPIHYAVERGEMEIVELLTETAADVNVRDKSQLTPLMIAAARADQKILQYLLIKRPELDLQDEKGFTAGMHAVVSDNVEGIRILLASGANPTILDHSGQSIITLVIEGGDVERFFLERGLIVPPPPPPPPEPLPEPVVPQEATPPPPPPMTKPTPPRVQSPKVSLTGVRAKGKPEGVWKRGKSLTLESVSVEVRNYGGAQANGVQVDVRIPGGKKIRLSGPANLPAYGEAVYSATPKVGITKNGKLKSFVTCRNCHR